MVELDPEVDALHLPPSYERIVEVLKKQANIRDAKTELFKDPESRFMRPNEIAKALAEFYTVLIDHKMPAKLADELTIIYLAGGSGY